LQQRISKLKTFQVITNLVCCGFCQHNYMLGQVP